MSVNFSAPIGTLNRLINSYSIPAQIVDAWLEMPMDEYFLNCYSSGI